MNRKDTDRVKRKVHKIEKLIAEYNERISKELSEITNILESRTIQKEEPSKQSRRRTPRRFTKDSTPIDGGLLSEGD